MELHSRLHYHEVADSNSTFALYVCAMASREKMSSENADIAFVSNCDHDYNYMVHIQKYCVVFQCINVLHGIMDLMLLWISKVL